MTYKENITAILECYFTGFKKEIIDSACNRILELEPCDDAISRQAVLDEAFEVDTKEYGRIDVVGVDAINSLPPVTPQPKTGRWIYIRNSEVNGLKIVKCSECGKRTYGSGKYCPNCGAKMVEPQESEE